MSMEKRRESKMRSMSAAGHLLLTVAVLLLYSVETLHKRMAHSTTSIFKLPATSLNLSQLLFGQATVLSLIFVPVSLNNNNNAFLSYDIQ